MKGLLLFLSAFFFHTSLFSQEEVGKVNLFLSESLDTSGRELYFRLITQKKYISNGNVDFRMEKTKDSIYIFLYGVDLAEISFLTANPASANVYIGKLEKDKTYALKIVEGKTSSTGTLLVEEKKITVNFADTNICTTPKVQINRIPQNTIWGYCDSTILKALTDSLIRLGAVEKSYAPGDYSYFKIPDNGTLLHAKNPHEAFFIFSYRKDFEAIRTMVWNIVCRNVRVFNDKGNSTRCGG